MTTRYAMTDAGQEPFEEWFDEHNHERWWSGDSDEVTRWFVLHILEEADDPPSADEMAAWYTDDSTADGRAAFAQACAELLAWGLVTAHEGPDTYDDEEDEAS